MLKIDTGPQSAGGPPGIRLGVPYLPNDHGAYAMLLVPMLLGLILGAVHGVAATSNPPVTFALFALSLISLFFASEPLSISFKPRSSTAARRRAVLWLGIYLFAAGLAGAPLLFIWKLWALGWFLAPAAALLLLLLMAVKVRKQRSLGIRLPGIVGLTLSAPAAYYIATGTLDETAWGLWAACTIYFAGTLFNVRAWFEANKQKKGGIATPRLPVWLVASILTYLVVGALIIWACALLGALPWWAFAAFVPSLFRAGWTLWRTPVQLPIKTVGLIEFAQSFLFALLLIVALTYAAQ